MGYTMKKLGLRSAISRRIPRMRLRSQRSPSIVALGDLRCPNSIQSPSTDCLELPSKSWVQACTRLLSVSGATVLAQFTREANLIDSLSGKGTTELRLNAHLDPTSGLRHECNWTRFDHVTGQISEKCSVGFAGQRIRGFGLVVELSVRNDTALKVVPEKVLTGRFETQNVALAYCRRHR